MFVVFRLKAVRDLAERLERDKAVKEKRRDFLIRQRDQLMLIFNYMSYTGQKTELEFKTAEASMIEKNQKLEVRLVKCGERCTIMGRSLWMSDWQSYQYWSFCRKTLPR